MVSLEMSLCLRWPDTMPTLATDHHLQPRDALKELIGHEITRNRRMGRLLEYRDYLQRMTTVGGNSEQGEQHPLE